MSVTALPSPRPPSVWRRLNHTPLRDLLRGRITGRLDVRTLIEQSNLAPALRDLVGQVVRRTRLWQGEKVDVARELIAHFRDGLEAGVAPEALRGAFGETRAAARLIRRAKRRARPIAWQAWRGVSRAVALVCALLLGLYAAQAIRLAWSPVRIERNFLAELSARVAQIPESERAWPLYRAAAVDLGPRAPLRKWDLTRADRDWPETKAWVAARPELAGRLRVAAGKAHLGALPLDEADRQLEAAWRESPPRPWPTVAENPPLMTFVPPHSGVLRNAQRLLAADAWLAAEVGDGERATADLLALVGVTGHMREVGTQFDELLALVSVVPVVRTVGAMAADFPDLFTETQLVELAHAPQRPELEAALAPRADADREWVLDLLQRFYSDENGDGIARPELLLHYDSWVGNEGGVVECLASPLVPTFVARRSEVLREYEYLTGLAAAEFRQPLWEYPGSRAEAHLKRLHETRVAGTIRYLVLAARHPGYEQRHLLAEYARQERDAVQAAIALLVHHRQKSTWPAALDELTPGLLPAAPLDRYDGRPLKYGLRDDRPLLYSVGADRDDDGGRLPVPPLPRGVDSPNQWARTWIAPEALAAHSVQAPDGDWILWPPP